MFDLRKCICAAQLVLSAARLLETATNSSTAILFFDDHWLASSDGAKREMGTPHLLAAFADPSAYVGWGSPNTWVAADGRTMMVYNGNHDHQHHSRLVLLAESDDGINFKLSPTSSWQVEGRLQANQLLPPMGDDRSSASGGERGWIFDDAAARGSDSPHRFKMLMANSSVLESKDGLMWSLRSKGWAPEPMDPMISAFRKPGGGIAVTSRPPALRHGGRHAGISSAADWHGLAKEKPRQCLPADNLFSKDAEIYGLPAFRYADMVVGFLVRMRCEPKCKWLGGHISAELAFSRDGEQFSRVGQKAELGAGLGDSPESVIFPNIEGSINAGQVYPTGMLPSKDGRSLLIYASVASVEHGHGIDSEKCPTCSCARNGGAPCSHIATYGLRMDGFVALAPAGNTPATVRTKLLLWHSGDLLLNADCSSGGIVEVQVIGENGSPLPGYAFAQSVAFRGNETAAAAQWSGGKSLATLSGRHLALELRLSGTARLFALRGDFALAESGAVVV